MGRKKEKTYHRNLEIRYLDFPHSDDFLFILTVLLIKLTTVQ